jgi:hypothetical protein
MSGVDKIDPTPVEIPRKTLRRAIPPECFDDNVDETRVLAGAGVRVAWQAACPMVRPEFS